MHKYLPYLLVIYLLFVPRLLWANTDKSLDQQRLLYQQALEALSRGKRNTYKKLAAQLADYPLHPYLQYAELATRIRLSSRQPIEAFLEQYDGLPVARRLRHRWLEYLRKRDRWRDYLKYHQAGNGTTEQRCYYQYARYRNGERDQAIEQALKLWSAGKSQPQACDKLFGILIHNKLISERLAWQRYNKALIGHQYQLARYLKRFFTSTHYRELADTYYKIHREPRMLGRIEIDYEPSPELLAVIERGIVHRARRDALSAMGYWSRYHQVYPFSAKAEKTIIEALVKGLYQQDQVQVADNYLKDNRYKTDTSLIAWRIRQAIGEGAWQTVLDWIDLLPAEYQQDKRWRYWSIRAGELLNPAAKDVYQQQYAQLADSRNYYSFLASEHAGLDYQLEHMPSNPPAEQIAAIEALPAFQRIRELLYHQELTNARREWSQATRNFSEDQWLNAAHVASRMGWHSKAISSMIEASYWDDIDIRFPVVHWKTFSNEARLSKIPLQWLIAVARQESSLATDAASSAGARGLMQLLPATARETARKNQIRYKHSVELLKPELNIKLGSLYFRQMLDRFGNNRILATAAYNAGPHRVDRWLAETDEALPFDAWIEQIPFKETRNYVQNVMAFSIIYAHHLNVKQAMLNGKEKQQLL